jgi:thioesterase domain-containing protein
LIGYCFEELKIANKLPTNNGFSEAEAILRVCQSNAKAMLNYVPRSYEERMIYFRAADRIEGQPRYPELPWIDLAGGGIEVHRVPGNHYTMLNVPNVKVLAERLKHCLEQLYCAAEKPAGDFQMARSMGGPVMQTSPEESHA